MMSTWQNKAIQHAQIDREELKHTRFAFASNPCRTYSHVNSSPRAPTQRGASLCRTESAKAHPDNKRQVTNRKHDEHVEIIALCIHR